MTTFSRVKRLVPRWNRQSQSRVTGRELCDEDRVCVAMVGATGSEHLKLRLKTRMKAEVNAVMNENLACGS
jgi:hypothetical protein